MKNQENLLKYINNGRNCKNLFKKYNKRLNNMKYKPIQNLNLNEDLLGFAR